MQIDRGFRCKLSDHIDISKPLFVRMDTQGGAVYDTCCFGLDGNDKMSDDRYTIFYNQKTSPENAIIYGKANNEDEYTINISKLPSNISKLIFTVSIDGTGTMGKISSHSVKVLQENSVVFEMMLKGEDFANEKAIIDIEIYKKNEWRIACVARGFDGGLDALVKNYGGEISGEPSDTPAQTAPTPNTTVQDNRNNIVNNNANREEAFKSKIMNKISLSKDKVNLEKHIVNLSKCVVDLEKKSGVDLGSITAKVVVAMDYSISMKNLYSNGTVQRTLDRLVPLGLTFDDNGEIELFLFDDNFYKFPDMNLENYETYVKKIIKRAGYTMGGTRYAPVIEAIVYGGVQRKVGFFTTKKSTLQPIVDDNDPTFVLFITDGENADRDRSDEVIRKISTENVFIQFIGIGNCSFSYLRKIDDLPGRERDNTGFSQMSELDNVDDTKLYNAILEQFSNWLKNLQ